MAVVALGVEVYGANKAHSAACHWQVLEEDEYIRRKGFIIEYAQRHYYFMNVGNGEVIDACRKVSKMHRMQALALTTIMLPLLLAASNSLFFTCNVPWLKCCCPFLMQSTCSQVMFAARVACDKHQPVVHLQASLALMLLASTALSIAHNKGVHVCAASRVAVSIIKALFTGMKCNWLLQGALGRFINHSCEPNCETQKGLVHGELAIGLFTTTDIPADTELTFDYNFERYGDKVSFQLTLSLLWHTLSICRLGQNA